MIKRSQSLKMSNEYDITYKILFISILIYVLMIRANVG